MCVQAAQAEAAAKAGKLEEELTGAQKHNMSLREELQKTKSEKESLDKRVKEMQGQVEAILGAAATLKSTST